MIRARIHSRSGRKYQTVDEALLHPRKKRDWGRLVMTATLIIALLGISFLGIYLGYVSYHEGRGGFIYELNIVFKRPSYNWAGLFGASFGVGVSQPWVFNMTAGDMDEENIFFECFERDIEHEIYASVDGDIDFAGLTAATAAEIDSFIGINSTFYDSAQNTFTQTISVDVGSTTISNVPATYTYVGSGTNATAFDVGLMKDSDGGFVIVAHVVDGLVKGFNERFYNYQMLLPIPNNGSQEYTLFSDPNDVCVGGNETPINKGWVYGTVTDITGNPLEDVIIVVGSFSTITDATGFYNTSAEEGVQYIFAIKEGYKVYQDNVTVVENNGTEHNIVLELVPEEQEGVDVGPGQSDGTDEEGTDVGPGEFDVERPALIEGQDYVILMARISKRIREGEFAQEIVTVKSFKQESMQLNLKLEGEMSQLTQMDKTTLFVAAQGENSVTLTFFGNVTPDIYNGSLNITGAISAELPIEIEVIDKDKIPIQALLLGISIPNKNFYPGSTLTFRTDLTNLLTDQQYPVQLLYTIQDLRGQNTIWSYNTNIFLKTSLSIIKNVEIPSDVPPGDYVIRVTANYLDLSSSASQVVTVSLPFYQAILFGKVRVWHALLALLVLMILGIAYYMIRKKIEAQKKYHLKVELNEIPKPGPRSIWVGKIAETETRTYMNIENFKTHTIVAGSTGGGKSFSAQVIIEEMLQKDVAVIVFDPTAQWTGMLRKLQNQGLLSLYPNFGMKPNDARAFTGNIRQITNPRELIDIRKYMKPGEIQVFACHKLDPKDIDMFVANTVREVFHENFTESEPLRLMLVYDEVHRLLPKFGGSGEGFLQIERACREFRKWGIGVMLISQVLADFVGQIKANINTEVQMRTRDEGDLDRIKTKYGADVLQSLVKASVGTGMVQNSAYNRGRPYFVTFRPIEHSVARLTDEEIEQYNKYNEKIDQLAYELEQLEALKQDVFDLKLELKLALDKVKAGNFNMVSIYLEGLEPRLKKLWEKLGQEPKKLEIRVVSEAALKEDIEKAKADRAKYEAENKQAAPGQAAVAEDPASKFKKDVPPDKILKLHNDMLVVNPKSLSTEIEAMKDSDFQFHVSETKNDFAAWIRNAIGDSELADLLDQETDRKEIIKLLEARMNAQKMPKLVVKKKPLEQPAVPQPAAEPPKEPTKEEREEALKQFEQSPEQQNSGSRPVVAEPAPEKSLGDFAKEPEKKGEDAPRAQVLDKEAPSGQYFILENGRALKSLKDLVQYLPEMPDNIFQGHVNEQKNDFASWIRGVFHEDQLAEKVMQARTKGSLEEVLMNA